MDVPVHDVLFKHNGEVKEKVEYIPVLREYLAGAPETKVTFKLPVVLPDDAHKGFSEEMVEFCGAWRAPDVYQASVKGSNFVNPNATDAGNYPDIIVECECGATIQKLDANADSPMVDNEDHDDCQQYHRWEARAELLREREAAYERLIGRFGWTQTEVADRVSISSQNVSKEMRRMGLDHDELVAQYRRRVGNTYPILRDRGYSSQECIDILGVSGTRLREFASDYGDFTAQGRGNDVEWVRDTVA